MKAAATGPCLFGRETVHQSGRAQVKGAATELCPLAGTSHRTADPIAPRRRNGALPFWEGLRDQERSEHPPAAMEPCLFGRENVLQVGTHVGARAETQAFLAGRRRHRHLQQRHDLLAATSPAFLAGRSWSNGTPPNGASSRSLAPWQGEVDGLLVLRRTCAG